MAGRVPRSRSSPEHIEAGWGARQIFAHTHLVRGGSVMLQPTRDQMCVNVTWILHIPTS